MSCQRSVRVLQFYMANLISMLKDFSPCSLSMNCSNEELGLLNPGANPNDYHDLQCPCELGVSLCPVNSSQGELWKYGSVSTDEFYDLSENNIPLWILQTYKSLKETRLAHKQCIASLWNVSLNFRNSIDLADMNSEFTCRTTIPTIVT